MCLTVEIQMILYKMDDNACTQSMLHLLGGQDYIRLEVLHGQIKKLPPPLLFACPLS